MKRCCTCGEVREVGEFSKNASRPDGLQLRCKPCIRAYYAKNADKIKARVNSYRLANREAVNERKRDYRARNPEQVSESSRRAYESRREYYQQRAREWYAQNTERAGESSRRWVQANRDVVRAAKSKHKHKRRALEAGSSFKVSGRDLAALLRRASGCCVYCGIAFSDDVPVTWDHIIPVTRGGSFGVGNLAPSCMRCNSSKNARTVTEWRMSKRRLVEARRLYSPFISRGRS